MERTGEAPRRAPVLLVIAALTLSSCGTGGGTAANLGSTLTLSATDSEAPREEHAHGKPVRRYGAEVPLA